MVPLPAYDVRLYFAGADKFRDLLADLREARTYVHLMYLIWEKDELTAEVAGILLERLRAGVEVNIIYDWLSSLPYKKDELEGLAAAGARVVPCYRRMAQLNYRNHMKMAIVDGRVVYSGGMNMGQEYIDGGPRFARWRDTHFRFIGPGAGAVPGPLRLDVVEQRARRGPLRRPPARPGPRPRRRRARPGAALQRVDDFPTLRDVFMVALMNARRPRLDPVAVLRAGRAAAHRDVRGGDQRGRRAAHDDRACRTRRCPFYAAHAYFPKLLEAGATVYRTTPGSCTPRP